MTETQTAVATTTDTQASTSSVPAWLKPFRVALLGRQDERLDALMENYFKLSPEGRIGVIVGGIVLGVLAIFGVIALYLGALSNLQGSLNEAFEYNGKISQLKSTHALTKQRFTALEKRIEGSNRSLSLVTVLEAKAKELGLSTSGFPAQVPVNEFGTGNPLSSSYQNARVEFKVNNVTLRKIIEYVVAVEAMPHMLRVTSLAIKAHYRDNTNFDATLAVEATVSKR